jgi:hypothetical protein
MARSKSADGSRKSTRSNVNGSIGVGEVEKQKRNPARMPVAYMTADLNAQLKLSD